MKMVFRCLAWIGIAIAAVGIVKNETLNAEIRRELKNAVLLGEWQPRKSSDTGKKGFFLSEIHFAPGTKLAVGILLEQPGETVTVRWSIEAPGKPKAEQRSRRQIRGGRGPALAEGPGSQAQGSFRHDHRRPSPGRADAARGQVPPAARSTTHGVRQLQSQDSQRGDRTV